MLQLETARILPLVALVWGISNSGVWAAESDSSNAALLSITSDEIKNFVDTLADDTFEGRDSNSRGNRAAGIYIIERLKKLGIAPGGPKNSYYQSFPNYANILGFVEGSDPQLKDQVLILGAHYDHVGYGTARNSFGPIGLIHNGADDNASGVAGLLEVAGAVAQLPEKPRRSILFAFWDGEERGLIGSQYWAEHPTFPLDRVPLMINADMIGRLRADQLTIFGSRTAAGLRRLVSRQNDVSQLLIDFTWEMKPDSDHHTFYSRGIPVLMIHTGLHSDYHRPSDDAEKVNVEGLKQVAQLMFKLVVDLADAPSLPPFRRQARQETRSDQRQSEQALPAPPGRLGIRWDEKAAEQGQILVTAVSDGSAAGRAGIRAGDRLLSFDGQPIQDARQFRQLVLAAGKSAVTTIARHGEENHRELTLELPGRPVRLGISWRTDEAEPNCVIVNRLTPGSAADVAGLRANDRIYRVGGQDIASAEAFRQLANQPGALVMEVETQGRVRTVEIPSLDRPADSAAQEETEQPPVGGARSE